MAPPPWLQRFGSLNTANTADKAASPSPSPPPALHHSRRLSLQDADEIDNWLSRLHRLEGALPPKAALPRTSPATTNYSRPASIAVDRPSVSTWSSSTSSSSSSGTNTPSNTSTSPQHHRRRSLALFGQSSESDHAPSYLQLPAPRPSTSSSILNTPEVSPRPSSQLEPSVRPSVLARAHSLLSTTSPARTDATTISGSKSSEDLPDPHQAEKTYYEVADGSYIVLTEVVTGEGVEGDSCLDTDISLSDLPPLPENGQHRNSAEYTRQTEHVEYSTTASDTSQDATDPGTRVSTPTQDTSGRDKSAITSTDDDVDLIAPVEQEKEALSSFSATEQSETVDMSSPSDSYNPNPTLSSSRSTKSMSTTSSHPSSGKLQPRSPFSSPKTTLSFRKGKKRFPLHDRTGSDVEDEDNDEDDFAGLVGESGGGSDNIDHLSTLQAPIPQQSETHRTSRLKKISKSSFSSSLDSVRGSLIASHDRRESSESKASSTNSHTLPHVSFFARNSAKHPQQQAQAPSPSSSAMQTSSSAQQYPKLVARDERFYSSRSTRPRFSSARSASSLKLGGELALPSTSSASDGEDESLLNPRRASISSTSPSFQRSKDEKRALLASSNNRISLAVPPPLTRSYSYDSRVHAANMAAYDPAELARHIPDMKQTVLLWIPEEFTNGLSSSASLSRLSQHNYHPSAAKGLANAILSNVPMHGRKKVVKRESTQVLFSEHHHQDIQEEKSHHDTHERKDKERHKHSSKGKEKASILLPAGHWKRCEAVLKATGHLVISNEGVCMISVDLTILQRTDVRLVDPSLLGRQRCVSLNIKHHQHTPLPLSPGVEQKYSPSFPLSPSAPDIFTFSSTTSTSSSSSGRFSGGGLEEPLQLAMGGQTLFLAFPTTALQQAWIASFLSHAQPEVYPALAAHKTESSLPEGSSSSEREDFEVSQSSRARPTFTQHSSWRPGPNSPGKPEPPVRMYRSVSLQIIQARCVREHAHPSLAQSLAALTIHGMPQSPSVTSDVVQVQSRSASLASDAVYIQKRSGSIASTVASGEASTSSTGTNELQIPASSSLPAHPVEAMSESWSTQRKGSLAGQPAIPSAHTKKSDSSKDKNKDSEYAELFIEVRLNGEILGRTGIRSVGAKTIWEEVFHFSNLGPYTHPLELLVFAIRKHQIQNIGKAEIPLPTIQRNIVTEGWFEVQPPEYAVKKGHFEMPGELNLRALVKEDTSLPFQAYSRLGALLGEDSDSTAILSMLDALQIELDLFAQLLLRIDTAHRRVLHRIISLCKKDVRRNDNLATLFRGNTLLTKTIEMYMRLVGSDFLDSTIGKPLRRICEDRVAMEIDPSRLDHKDSLQENIKSLEGWCEIIWSSVYNSRHSCPMDLRRVLRKVRQIVDEHCEAEQAAGRLNEADRVRARCTSVSAFISLRFFCPAILRPNLFRLCPSHPPDVKTSRTLTLITKVLLGMANVQTFGTKEPWMAAMNPFLQKHSSSYQDFITYLCSKEEGVKSDWTEKEFEPYKIPILKRMTLVPDIVKEGVPELPFLVDLPKEYAALASLVATAEPFTTPPPNENASNKASMTMPHDELVAVCQVLHGQIRSRVRALGRAGDLTAPSREHSRKLLARTEQVRLPMRIRGSTVSKPLSTPSPDRTAILSRSSPAGSVEEARAALFASSPASVKSGSLANLSASTSPSMGSSSESQMSISSLHKPKRRSYTISASPSMPHSDTSPISHSAVFSRPLPAQPVDEEDDASDILDIKNPVSSPSPTAKEPNPRRLTIIAPRPLALDQSMHPVPVAAGAKTPRAPTFTREQSENLRELQETLSNTAFDDASSSIGVMPSHRAEPPTSPVPAQSMKRKLFRKR